MKCSLFYSLAQFLNGTLKLSLYTFGSVTFRHYTVPPFIFQKV